MLSVRLTGNIRIVRRTYYLPGYIKSRFYEFLRNKSISNWQVTASDRAVAISKYVIIKHFTEVVPGQYFTGYSWKNLKENEYASVTTVHHGKTTVSNSLPTINLYYSTAGQWT